MNETEVRSKEQKIEEQLSNAVTILKEEQKSCVISEKFRPYLEEL